MHGPVLGKDQRFRCTDVVSKIAVSQRDLLNKCGTAQRIEPLHCYDYVY